jgi:hypothetical protein
MGDFKFVPGKISGFKSGIPIATVVKKITSAMSL